MMKQDLVIFTYLLASIKIYCDGLLHQVKPLNLDYSGPLRATCPEFESHHSGE